MAGKRGNGEGSVYRRDDGRWVAAFSYVDEATGRTKRSVSYGKTKAEAVAKREERRKRVEKGQPVRDARVTLADFVARWTESTLQVADLKATTRATYATLARRYLGGDGIGAVTLDRLKPTDVERLVLHMREAGKSQSTIRQTYTVLRKVLDAAVRDGYVARNVAALVKRPGVDRHEAEFLTAAELGRLLKAADGSRYAAFLTLLAYTGLRRGEGLALRWADVNLDEGTLYVRGTLARVEGALTITEPKTDRSRRVVPLAAPVVALLKSHHARQAAERLHAGPMWEESGLVFTTATGAPVDPRNALRAFTVAAKAADLSGISLHTLRHSAASAMLGAGVPLTAVSEVLGHSSVAITGDVYGHIAPDLKRSALDALAGALNRPHDATAV